jgi:processing peptidase subunit beta
MTTLSNGIRVCTERTSHQTASVGVFVGAGSRNEDLETSGTAYLLEKMFFRGTPSHSKSDITQTIENMGARLESQTGRESQSIQLQVFRGDVNKAVKLIGDLVCNSTLNANELEIVKEEVAEEHEGNADRYLETTIENSHYNIYREHMMGQPIKGDRDNLQSLGVDQLRNFHATHYFGDNIVVVGAGNINHDEFVNQVSSAFQSLPKQTAGKIKGKERPIYIPALLFVRDDEMVNSNVGIFYDAPSIKDPDYYSFLLLKNMFGSFNIEKHATHLNDVKKQYNSMHAMLGDLPDVTIAESLYYAYSDCGIFGNYFFGNEVFTRQMNYCGVCLPTIYSHYLNDVEVFRGRNKLYNKLMTREAPSEVVKEVGNQILSLGRRVPRSEVAKRVAHLDNHHIKHLCNDWFYDAEPSFTNWGPIETVSQVGSYKYFKINTMATVSNAHHSLYT